MPFQDIDETDVVEVPRPPTALERGVRKIFVEDWSLKLLALAITLVLWFAVTGQNKPLNYSNECATQFDSAEQSGNQ